MIPRVMHFMWLQGLDAMPDKYRRCYESWAPMHPGWSVRLWTADDLFWIHNAWVWDDRVRTIVRADVARFEVVLRYGGVYLDCDQECVRPIDDLVLYRDAFASMRDDRSLAPAGFGATHGHPWMLRVVEELDRSRCTLRDGLDVDAPFGRVTWSQRPQVDVLPAPFLNARRSDLEDVNTRAYHHVFSDWRGPHAARA